MLVAEYEYLDHLRMQLGDRLGHQALRIRVGTRNLVGSGSLEAIGVGNRDVPVPHSYRVQREIDGRPLEIGFRILFQAFGKTAAKQFQE